MSVLTPAMAEALRDGYPRGIFVAIEHPSGTGYFCSGVGLRSWDGHTWSGSGEFGSVTPIKRTSEIAIQDIVFRMSGVDAAVVAGLADDVRNLNGSAWLACFHPDDDSVIADPMKLVDAELDFQTIEIDADGTATIEITAHSGFYDLDNAVEEAWTPENQRLAYPTDTGLDMIPVIQNQDLLWTPT